VIISNDGLGNFKGHGLLRQFDFFKISGHGFLYL
jgi:hypothetical protein